MRKYSTPKFIGIIREYISRGHTRTAIKILKESLPANSPFQAKVLSIESRFSINRKRSILDVLHVWEKNDESRIIAALIELIGEIKDTHPGQIQLRKSPYVKKNLQPQKERGPKKKSKLKNIQKKVIVIVSILAGLTLVAALFSDRKKTEKQSSSSLNLIDATIEKKRESKILEIDKSKLAIFLNYHINIDLATTERNKYKSRGIITIKYSHEGRDVYGSFVPNFSNTKKAEKELVKFRKRKGEWKNARLVMLSEICKSVEFDSSSRVYECIN